MLRRIINAESRTITGAAILLSVTTLVSRLVGVARDRTFAHFFGAGPVMDAYYAAFKIPDLIYNLLIAGALTAAFIPTFTRLFYNNKDKSDAFRLADNIITIVGISLITLVSIGLVGTPLLVRLIAPGFGGAERELVISFTRIMLLSPLLLGVSMVLGGILQSLRQFFLYSIAPIFYNLGIIAGATLFTQFLGPAGLAWGVVFGALLHFSIQCIGAWHNGYRYHWRFSLKDSTTRLIGKLMVPRTLGLAMNQVNAVVVTALASLLPFGSVAIFNYANNLQDVPTGIIGIPFALAVFPILSEIAGANDNKKFADTVRTTARQILFLIVPFTACFLLLRAQIVRVILGTGEFDWTATIATANALAFFALGMFAQSLIPLYARAFYALNNTMVPFVVSIISEIFCVIASLLLMRPLGVPGLALADALAAVLNMTLLFLLLHRRVGNMLDDNLMKLVFKITTAGIVMGVVMQVLKIPLAATFDQHYFWGILGQGLVAGIIGFIVYGIICFALRVEEMTLLAGSIRRKWLKIWNIGEGIDEAEKL